mgnify:CR=1 FL=1
MARVKYWGLTVVRDIEEGILVSMRIDEKFLISKITKETSTELQVFHPSDILEERENTLEKKFKKYVSNYTKERIRITPDVKRYLSRMAARLKK